VVQGGNVLKKTENCPGGGNVRGGTRAGEKCAGEMSGSQLECTVTKLVTGDS